MASLVDSTSKGNHQQMKGQPMEQEKIFANHIYDN